MKSFLLQPVEILPQVSFMDAMMWVAFDRYPDSFSDIAQDSTKDMIKEMDYEEPDENFKYVYEFFTSEICEKYGLPENIELRYAEEGKETPISLRVIESILDDGYSSKEVKESVKSELPKSMMYNEKESGFYAAVSKMLEEAKHRVYAAIKESRLRLYGLKYYSKGYDEDNLVHSEIKFDLIPADIVSYDDLEFFRMCPARLNCADHGFYFEHLLVSTEDLFKNFQAKEVEAKTVKRINGAYVLENSDNVIKAKKPIGRKKAISDKELMCISVYLNSHSDQYSGEKQDYVIGKVIEWFEKEFGRKIPYQTMRGRIVDFLKNMKTKM